MPKQAVSGPENLLTLDLSSPVPLHRQIYDRIRVSILNGQMHSGQRLPSTRTLAGQLGISRNTVNLAYEQLYAEGYLESKVGSGTTVTHGVPETLLNGSARSRPAPLTRSKEAVLGLSELGRTLSETPGMVGVLERSGPPRAFRGGVPALDVFPFNLWSKILARRSRQSLPGMADYHSSGGYRPLREAIAAYVGLTRGVRCHWEQVIVVAGAQSGMDLAARLLVNPGELAWFEDPGYFGTRHALENAGVRLAPVPVDKEGLEVQTGMKLYPEARLVSVTAAHQFPLGVTMSLNRRLALLEWAREKRAWILEDDYNSEFRFSGRPIEALQGLDRADRVIYIGTFSKALFPALRLGFLVVPPALVDPFISLRRNVDRNVPILEQMVLTDFMAEGHFTRHIRRMRALYAERKDALVSGLKSELDGFLEVEPPEGGLQLVGWLPPGFNDGELAQKSSREGVEVFPISWLSLRKEQRHGLMMGYGCIGTEQIRAGVQNLAKILLGR